MRLLALTFATSAIFAGATLSASAAYEGGTAGTCTAGAKAAVRGEQRNLDMLLMKMPNNKVVFNKATAYSHVYTSNVTKATWYVESASLVDSGTYGFCSPTA